MDSKYLKHDKTFYSEAEEQTRDEFRTWLKNMLHLGPVNITFRKQNGEERVMNCTLQEGVAIPHVKTTDRVKQVDPELCSVWDIDKGAWRSFYYESVLKIDLKI
jgi:mannitol/fructose-specific phosphotransferase system IIA component (Ntr-type)